MNINPKMPLTDAHRTEPPLVRWVLILLAVLFIGLMVVIPIVAIFVQALAKGWSFYIRMLTQPETLAAIRLTVLTVLIVVPLNILFGVAAAWAVAKFDFPGKNLLGALIDLPFAISPVVAGLLFVLLFGMRGWFGPWLSAAGVKIIFAFPGIVLATLFVTFPLVARELIPIMEAVGSEEEEAALTLGATGWQTFRFITLPGIKWGLFYGIVLCTARAIGEFGAVSVVSGHIRGMTNTVPLQVEILYNEYNFTAAFAVASILLSTAILTLCVKYFLEKNRSVN